MQPDSSFSAAYRALEQRMQTQAEADGDVFLPNPAPERPVEYETKKVSGTVSKDEGRTREALLVPMT
jgi:hypothetical protein